MLTRGFLGSVLLLLGGLLSVVLPPSSWAMRQPLLVDLRATALGPLLVAAGLCLLTVSWVQLCRRAAGDRTGDALGLVRHATVVWCAPLVLAPPLFSRDGWSYAAQGMLVHLGISPYDHGPGVLHGPVVEAVDPRWLATPTPYGPLPLELGGLAASLTGNPWVLVVAHRLVALAGLALLAWAVPRLAAWTRVDPAFASALVLASPLVLAHGVGGLHNDLLMAGLMAVALVVGVERGWTAGAAVGGLAAAVKLPGGLVCLGIALAGLPAAATLVDRTRRLAAVGAVAVGTLFATGVASGLGSGWVHGLGVPATVTTSFTPTARIGELVGATDAVRTLGTLLSAVVLVAVAARWRTGDRPAAVAAVAVATGAVVLLSPVVQLWYLLWVVPFAAVLPVSPVRVRPGPSRHPARSGPPPSPAPSTGG